MMKMAPPVANRSLTVAALIGAVRFVTEPRPGYPLGPERLTGYGAVFGKIQIK